MKIVNMKKVKKQSFGDHGGALFQRILGRGTDNPDLMVSVQGVARITIPPGEANEMHAHEHEEQVYIVLRGQGEVQVGDEKARAVTGDVVYLPPKVPHGFRNTSEKACVLLNIGARTM